MTEYGLENPHPLSRMKTELVWEGKYDEYGNRRAIKLPVSPMPLQRIETIDEPHDREKARQLGLFDEGAFHESAHRDDWRNRLIWGDNKLVLASLLQEFRGKIDLIYIDPPFDVGADFTMKVQIGDEGDAVQKEQSILEAVAYRDTWGKGTDSYLHMMYERLTLMRDLLSERGSIYVHCDWRVNFFLRSILNEIFGDENFRNEIAWCYRGGGVPKKDFAPKHDTILRYTKTDAYMFDLDSVRIPYSEDVQRSDTSRYDKSYRDNKIYEGYRPNELGKHPEDWWPIQPLMPSDKTERLDYPTQKPVELIQRIVDASTAEDSIILDAFCGSGTILAVAEGLRVERVREKSGKERLNYYHTTCRRWIGIDFSRYAIHTTRKRLIQVQRELHEQGQPYRSFDVYNLGRYERQWWQLDRLKGADAEHRRIVLQFYKAAVLESPPHPLLYGKKGGAYVHIDQIDSIFSFDELRAVSEAVRGVGGRELHCLAWEFEMELALKKQAIEAESGLTIRLKYIPREIMEPNRSEVQFFEAGALEAQSVVHEGKVNVALARFTPSLAEAPEKELVALRERAVRSPFDFIDFWAVDFDYSPDQPFEHHWQDFRTRKDRSLKTTTDLGWHYDLPGKHQIAVKVIDVFGVDTTIVLDVEI